MMTGYPTSIISEMSNKWKILQFIAKSNNIPIGKMDKGCEKTFYRKGNMCVLNVWEYAPVHPSLGC